MSSQQAAALQRGLQGLAPAPAMRIPPAAIYLCAEVNADPVADLLQYLAQRFERIEEKTYISNGASRSWISARSQTNASI
eukprot:2837113-Pyramimonas_sp.AAC.1